MIHHFCVNTNNRTLRLTKHLFKIEELTVGVVVMNEEKNHPQQVLMLALDIGEKLTKCGAEIGRVEDSIIRICKAYGVKRIDVFAIRSLIIATIQTTDGDIITQTRRIYSYGTNLEGLEGVNTLSRLICETAPNCIEVREKINELEQSRPPINFSVCLGCILIATSSCIYFGGEVIDMVPSAIVAAFIFYLDNYFKKDYMNQVLYMVLCSMLAGMLTILLVKLGIGKNIDKIMIGDIMVLIPGLGIMTAVREILSRDLLAGLMRFFESILVASAIACGFSLALYFMGGILQ